MKYLVQSTRVLRPSYSLRSLFSVSLRMPDVSSRSISRAPACTSLIAPSTSFSRTLKRRTLPTLPPLTISKVDTGARLPLLFSGSRPLSTTRSYFQSNDTPLEAPDTLNDAERQIFAQLNEALEPTTLTVQDVSGGCGSMYALDISSPKFSGLNVVAQHRLVNRILKESIGQWHGLQLKTRPS